MTSQRLLDRMDGLTHRLIHRAAQHAPGVLCERLEEEWLADLSEQRGCIARLRFALGCCWATLAIAREHAATLLPATSSPLGLKSCIRYSEDDSSFFTDRGIAIVLVASLHAAVFCGFAVGLGPRISKFMVGPITAQIIERHERADPPPAPRPRITPARIEVPPQEAMPSIEADPAAMSITEGAPADPPDAERRAPEPKVVNRVQGGPGVGFPRTDDFYPDASRRAGETGIATILACVDGKGRLSVDPAILQSTGSARLDESALRLARAGSGHYRATTEDGRPVNACYPFRIRFELRN